jgi:hypothetical protein
LVLGSRVWSPTTYYGYKVSTPFIAYFNGPFGTDTVCKNYELLDPYILSLYPNPVKKDGEITVNFNSPVPPDLQCQLFDITGKSIPVQTMLFMSLDRNAIISLPVQIAQGIYFLNLNYNNQSVTKKIMVYGY